MPRNPYWGVSWNLQKKKFQAKLRFDHGERMHVGYYDSAIDAARAYNSEALKRLGQFATLAVIEGEQEFWQARHQEQQPIKTEESEQ